MQELVPRRKLSDEVAARIKRYILDHGLKPGDRLPTEHDLAHRFGVSRISVREATKALGFLGILDAAPRRGLRVGRIDMRRVTQYLGFHLAINDYPGQQLIETRIVIETGGLPHVAQRMMDDPSIYQDLDALNDRLRQARNLQQWIELDIAFHHLLLESSGLAPLVAFNELLEIFFRKFRESVNRAEWQAGADSHQRILEALRDQKLAEACDQLRKHIESHKQRMPGA